MLYISFWQRNLACIQLGIRQHLEYRFNFVIDSFIQPTTSAILEMAIWYSLVKSMAGGTLGGFDALQYVSYAMWASFFSRQMSTWSQDYAMMTEIQTGTLNSCLVRPLSFFEYHFFQFLGQRAVSLTVSLLIPLVVSLFYFPNVILSRIPLALVMGFSFLFFTYCLSFLIVCSSFVLTRVNSIIFAKNIGMWMLTGDLYPLDLLPSQLASIAKVLPFASGVYLPVGYITGRVDLSAVLDGFMGLGIGTAFIGLLCVGAWRAGMKRYTGVGA